MPRSDRPLIPSDNVTGPPCAFTLSRTLDGTRNTRPGEAGQGSVFRLMTLPSWRTVILGMRTGCRSTAGADCGPVERRLAAGCRVRSIAGVVRRGCGHRRMVWSVRRGRRATGSATCRPSRAAMSAVSTGWIRLPIAKTPGLLVRNAVSTTGPRVLGSMSNPAERASSWSGIQSPVSTRVSHSMMRRSPVSRFSISTACSAGLPMIRVTRVRVATSTPRMRRPARRC